MTSRFRRTLSYSYHIRAISLHHDDHLEEALCLMLQAIQLNPTKSLYWEDLISIASDHEEYNLVLYCLRKLSRFKKYSKSAIEFFRAKTYLSQGRFRPAIAALRRVGVSEQDSLDLRIIEAKCYMGLGRFKRALALLNKLEPNNQDYFACEFQKGVCSFFMKKYQAAICHLNNAAYHAPYRLNPDLLLLKGSSHYNLGEYERAVISYEELLAIDASYSEVALPLDLARQKIGWKGGEAVDCGMSGEPRR